MIFVINMFTMNISNIRNITVYKIHSILFQVPEFIIEFSKSK